LKKALIVIKPDVYLMCAQLNLQLLKLKTKVHIGDKMLGANNFDFQTYKKNKFSQWGEDGIIEEILKRIKNSSDKQCCEFGAWDGKFLSNTYNLITNHNYEAILIEADIKKFRELCITFPEKKIIKINEFVNFTGKNTLDNILLKTHFNKDFDFLSIDIDGCDYYIFESLSKFAPKVICVEFNPSIAKNIYFVQEKNMKIMQGSSARSIIDLGLKKDYFPIASTNCNIFFIHKKFIINSDKFNIDKLLQDLDDNFLYYGYDGKVFSSKPSVLVNILNIFPGKIIQKIFVKLERFICNPIKFISKLRYYLPKMFK
jgi:hypothetical protein